MANVQLTQSAIVMAVARQALGVQITQSAIVMAVRRVPVNAVMKIGTPQKKSDNRIPKPPVSLR